MELEHNGLKNIEFEKNLGILKEPNLIKAGLDLQGGV
jgi:hypothetical protein